LWSATEHKEWVVNARVPKLDGTKILSGSTQGDVKFWDIRAASANPTTVKSYKSIAAHRKGMMTALAVHDAAPLLATY
jgi:regulator-associated protein of mTOR